MRRRQLAAAALGLVALVTARQGRAHSPGELEKEFGALEKYFQPIDKPAPGFTLRDAEGATIRLADFHGKVVVLHFIYAGCPDVCPLHAEKIAEIQAMVNRTPMKDQVQFLSITTDPTRDTPDVLKAYGPAHKLDAANWTFLTTTPDQPEDATRKLVEAYGHKFIKTEEGDQVHSVVTHVIDGEGRWRANFHSLRFESTSLVLFINALVNDVHEPQGHGEEGFWGKLRSWF